jgi:hypothetical protein
MTEKSQPGRSPGNTMLGVSMTVELKAAIRKAAEKENRTMANWCAVYLQAAVDEIQATTKREAGGKPPTKSA